MLLILLGVHIVGYTCYDDVWGNDTTSDIIDSLFGVCKVMGLHMHIALVDLKWGYE